MNKVSKRHVLFDGTSATSSTYTSGPIFWGDFLYGSVQWADGGNSVLTVEASNEDGFRSSLVTYSALTGMPATGLYTIDPGPRWVRVVRNSADSLSQVYIQGGY